MPLVIEPDADDPDFAVVMVDVTVAGRPYRLVLDTGAARTELPADSYTTSLSVTGRDSGLGVFGGSTAAALVTVTDLALGPLRVPALDVVRGGDARLGMDVLGRYRCLFRLAAGVLELAPAPPAPLAHEFLAGPRGHVYLEPRWPGVSAQACWDTGAGVTVVDSGFWRRHPELFEQIGTSAGTDASGDRAETPLLLMAGPVIGGRRFARHKAAAVDLAPVNSTLEYPMDLILGYPALRQAGWLFDFPGRRWGFTD